MKKAIVNSIIGKNSTFKGNLHIKNSVEVFGKFEGSIEVAENLLLREGSFMKSNVKASNIEVSGTLIGNIYATQNVIITASGKVTGDISASSFKIEDGGITKGNLNIQHVTPPETTEPKK